MSETDVPFRSMVLEEFQPLIGRSFLADCDPAPVEITLVEAYPLRESSLTIRPPFMLIFRTPPEFILLEGSYVFRCGDWGPDRISIWPTVAPVNGLPGHYYQAVFN